MAVTTPPNIRRFGASSTRVQQHLCLILPRYTVDATITMLAALAGLDLSETVTLPSVEDASELLAAYDDARTRLLGAARTEKPPRATGLRPETLQG